MVVVPVLLGSVEEVERILAHLEVQALGNLDPRIHFAVLSDFKDAPTLTVPGDDEILNAAVAGIEALNRRHASDGNDRFYLFHRDRQWNPRQGVFMGWERKRGKLEELNRRLRSATGSGFSVEVGDLSILPSVRYVLTLDADTQLPRDAARTLVGILLHPLNRAVVDLDLRRVTAGYGILQPRVSINLASAAGSLFARVYAGHTGVDPYTTAVSDTYQDLFAEGSFTGKGLYDVDAFQATVGWRVPENALLSHDLFEGLYARTALVSDVEVVDDYPANVLSHARREHRWVRGDWQILAWLFPWVPTPQGLAKNRLPLDQPVEDPRQPPPQPRGARAARLLRGRVDPAAGQSAALDPGRPLGGRVPVGRLRLSTPGFAPGARAGPDSPPGSGGGPEHRLRAGAPDPGLPAVPRLGDGPRHRAHAGSPRHHPPPPPRVGDGGLAGGAGGGPPAPGDALLLRRDGREPDRGPGAAGPGRRHPFRRAAAGPAVPRRLGCGARLRLLAEPVHRTPRPRAGARGPGFPDGDRAQDLVLLRDPGRRRRPLAPSRQLPGRAGARGGPSDLSDQHGPGSPLDPRGTRPGPDHDGGDGRAARPDADHDRSARAPRGSPPQLVRHPGALASVASLRLDRRQRQSRGSAAHPGGRLPPVVRAIGCVASRTCRPCCPTWVFAPRPWRKG